MIEADPLADVAPAAVPPLRTQGQRIVDSRGQPITIAAVNWYGAESPDYAVGGLHLRPLAEIVAMVRRLGFNAVRLPWSNQMLEEDPVVPDRVLAANPDLRGQRAMAVFERVVAELAAQGLMIILDNHLSHAGWCCGEQDDLWYDDDFPESNWLRDWTAMASRFRDQPMVVGADLRNEPRLRAAWGGPPETNWPAAAERAAEAVLGADPDLLVFVQGLHYGADLSGVRELPLVLALPDRLVYEIHDYAWFRPGFASSAEWREWIDHSWGFLVREPGHPPLFVGEFGTCNTDPRCLDDPTPGSRGFWFQTLIDYVGANRLGWAYWPLNGTQSTGRGREWGSPERYGILNPTWDGIASTALVERLRQIAN